MPRRSTHRCEGRRPCLKTCSYPWKLRERLEKTILRTGSVLLKSYIALGIGISGVAGLFPRPGAPSQFCESSGPCSNALEGRWPHVTFKRWEVPTRVYQLRKSFRVLNLSGLLFKWTLLWFPFLLQNFFIRKEALFSNKVFRDHKQLL